MKNLSTESTLSQVQDRPLNRFGANYIVQISKSNTPNPTLQKKSTKKSTDRKHKWKVHY